MCVNKFVEDITVAAVMKVVFLRTQLFLQQKSIRGHTSCDQVFEKTKIEAKLILIVHRACDIFLDARRIFLRLHAYILLKDP
jgi:hypothetical protein